MKYKVCCFFKKARVPKGDDKEFESFVYYA